MAVSKRTILPLTLVSLSLAGCAGIEAGNQLDRGNFGAANTNNIEYHTGERQATLDLSGRFANEVLTTVNFNFNSARLDAEAMTTLREQARWISQFPEVRFRVYGHTDAVGSDTYNQRLGLRRANAVVSFLASQGIDKSRLEAVSSFGERQPLIVSQGRERRNRRTVTEVSGFVQGGMILDGNYASVVYREYVRNATAETTLSNGLTSLGGITSGDGG